MTSERTQLAVFLPRLSSDVALTLNGIEIRRRQTAFRAHHDYWPLLVSLPEQALMPAGESNQLTLTLFAYSGIEVLSRFYLGPTDSLGPVYRIYGFFRQEFTRTALGITLVLGVFMLTIWSVRRRLTEYGWLGVAFLAFSYYLYNFIRISEPAHYALYTWSFLAARAIFIWAFVVFMHRYLNLNRRWLERAGGLSLALIFVVAGALAVMNRYDWLMQLTLVTSLPLVLAGIAYVFVTFGLHLLRSGQIYLHWLCVGALAGLLLGIYDILVLLDIQHWLVLDFFVSHYAILFSIIGAGGVLTHQIARALLDSEDLNRELNRQLELRTRELEQAAQEKLNQEKRLALFAERQRIMGDMHDGIGGQLVNLIAASRAGNLNARSIAAELDRIFADLRLVLDALSPAGEDLIAALARLRERYDPLISKAGITLGWRIDPGLDQIPMSPGATVNVLRLIQEALQNAVKHADAREIRVFISNPDDQLIITVSDDGRGFQPSRISQGHGFANMRRRAGAVGGLIQVDSEPGSGTSVSLSLPFHPA